jgi:signal transduction histidine kinase
MPSVGVASAVAKKSLRLAIAGAVVALLVAAVGVWLERSRFGATDEASVARVEAELRQRVNVAADTLGTIAARVAASQGLIQPAARDDGALRLLFDALTAALPDETVRRTGVTVYSHPAAVPIAWSGRVSDLPKQRIEGPAALFVAPRGRLIRIEPVTDRERAGSVRLATIVVEQSLGEGRVAPQDDALILPTSLVPVTLRAGFGPATTGSPYTFLIPSRGGQVLMEAEMKPADLADARSRLRLGTGAAVWSVLGITMLLCCSALLDARRRLREPRMVVFASAGILGLLAAARAMFWFAAPPLETGGPPINPFDLLLTALLLAAAVWLVLDLVERRRVARPRPRLVRESAGAVARTVPVYLAAGAIGAALLWTYERFLQNVVWQVGLDLEHFSLHPLVATRLGLVFGLVLLHASVVWSVALVLRVVAVQWRRPRATSLRTAAIASWIAGNAMAIVLARRVSGPVPFVPLLVALAAAGTIAAVLAQPRGRARRASQTTRLFGLYLALLVPAMAMYPSLNAFATEAKERLIAADFGPEATSQRENLWSRLPRALDQIDSMATLADFVTSSAEDAAPTTDRAFLVWSQTELARYRLTSAVELYRANGRLISRFALYLPEYTPTAYRAASCDDWDAFEEVSPFGSSERHVLHASRGICDRGRTVGAIVVRAMFDYRDLPFISAQSRYLESLGPDQQALVEGTPGSDIEFIVYGWSRAPLYTSGPRVWPLSDQVFQRMVENRGPLWDTVARDNETFRVYYLNTRWGIYALGYPVVTWFGHLVNLAELVMLTFALYVLFLGGSTAVNALRSAPPASGRALLRELRSSFYLKLFLFFVAASVVPVAILALAISAYFSAQLRAGVEEAAVNTATVAQRLVEDYAALEQQGTRALELLDDQTMNLVGQAINQEVDLFDGARLQATSERDLYASGVLATRTPSEVYRQIAVDRRPTFVGVEEMGGAQYQIAAAPVRAGTREGIVTVPQTLRKQDIERQIDELNRQVVLGLVLFVLLGAAIGYSMAERIADPVNRLTRATRRIARGDLDARVAATSSDELRRLVEDFNRMAADLKRQRTELERTQRLEAWAEMARQVAHDIKNPLTPIQLSAEHARRVNLDRGSPLSPALDECINSILTQVKLLRQIAAEFSSFASSPVAHPEPTEMPALIEEVVQPYRVGLAGRIGIDVQSAPDLPRVSIDRTLFSRALTNIIENALHAMPGGGRLTFSARRSAVDRQQAAAGGQQSGSHVAPGFSRTTPAVIVEITDTGVGMDQEALAKIFEPYFSTKATGTGLGLTIAKRNVELNGGAISVTSARGVGTTVTIVLPVPVV